MKKTTVFIILIMLFSFCLMACDPATYYFDYEELKETVVGVELINYNNPNAKELFEKRDQVVPFDFDKMEVVEILSYDELDDFLRDFSTIEFMLFWRHLDSPKGISVRLIYENGDFEVISCQFTYTGSFDNEGNVKRFIGGISWGGSVLDKYFNTLF